jgi:hypothetical protein
LVATFITAGKKGLISEEECQVRNRSKNTGKTYDTAKVAVFDVCMRSKI